MSAHGHPIAELVLTVLSQSTNDRNRDVAYLRLRARLPRWEQVRDAPPAAVEEAIRPGGISRVKSVRIQAILGRSPPICRASGLSLDWLARAPLGEARDYLVALPGVGRKTAACVLLFAYGLREVPVDTHVSRVGMRLGLLRAGAAVRGAARSDARAHAARRTSSSCTSTCCATGGAPATRAGPPAGTARSRGCARAASCRASRQPRGSTRTR